MDKHSQLNIIKARNEHLLDIYSLLNDLDLSIDGVSDHISNFFVLIEENLIIGVIGLEIYEDVGLVRSVGIAKSHQDMGLGKKLVEALELYAFERSLKEIFLFTETAETFFSKHFEFRKIPVSEVDSRIKQSKEYTLCQTSTVMIKTIQNV